MNNKIKTTLSALIMLIFSLSLAWAENPVKTGVDYAETTFLFARTHIIIKIDTALSEKFKDENSSVLFSGMADADLINTIDRLSCNLIKQ